MAPVWPRNLMRRRHASRSSGVRQPEITATAGLRAIESRAAQATARRPGRARRPRIGQQRADGRLSRHPCVGRPAGMAATRGAGCESKRIPVSEGESLAANRVHAQGETVQVAVRRAVQHVVGAVLRKEVALGSPDGCGAPVAAQVRSSQPMGPLPEKNRACRWPSVPRYTPRCACPAPRSRTPALHWQPRERCHTTLLANAPEPFVAGRHLRSEPLRCWALVEHQDGSTSLEGLVRDEEWLSEPGGAEFPKAIRGPHAHVGYASATAGLGHSGSRAA